jgi:hypothetical protein
MDQNEYRKARETGELVTDAALRDATTEVTDDQYEEDVEEVIEEVEEESADELEDTESDVEEEVEQLTPKEQTAFQKRLEREQKKLEEKLRSEMEEQYKQKYSKHDEVISSMGGDPDKILSAAKEAQLLRDAQKLADQNGWSEADTQWYVEDQKNKQELKELRVQMQINKLKDQPDYIGIDRMEKDIVAKIERSNGALTVEEAFWALGGNKRVEQVKLEAQQREVAKRAQQPRTVQKDAPSTSIGEKPLPASVLAEAKKMGISEAEARRLMSAQSAQTIDEWREKRKVAAK